jgi:hypothetical protein
MQPPRWLRGHPQPNPDSAARRDDSRLAQAVEDARRDVVSVERLRRARIVELERAAGARTCATCRYALHLQPVPLRAQRRVVVDVVIGSAPTTEPPYWEGVGPEAQCRRSIPPTWHPVNLEDWCGEWAPLGGTPPAKDVVGAAEGLPDSGLTTGTAGTVTRPNYLNLYQFDRLDRWGRQIKLTLESTAYLVGSATQRPDFRDVDVRVVLEDDVYGALDRLLNVERLSMALSAWGQIETGLPIDFQIQRMTDANVQFGGERHALGIRTIARYSDGPRMPADPADGQVIERAPCECAAGSRHPVVHEGGCPVREQWTAMSGGQS